MSHNMISEEAVQLNVEAKDWEDAIRKSAQPLVTLQKVKPEYIDAIIQTVKETGPYFVIMEHVAMPHADSRYGVMENGFSLATLKEAVCFGHENDPVKYLICLASIDNDQHLKNISRVAELLSDESFFKMLDETTDKEKICERINGGKEET